MPNSTFPILWTSDEYRVHFSAIRNGNRTHVRFVFEDQNVTLTDSNVSLDGGVTLYDYRSPDQKLTFKRASVRELHVTFINSSVFDGFNWEEEFRFDFGVERNNSIEWATIGYFHGKRPTKLYKQYVIEFKAYDRMDFMNTLADDFLNGYATGESVKFSDFTAALCSYFNLQKYNGNDIPDVSNMYICPRDLFNNGITFKQIVAQIAETNACFARITCKGDLQFVTWDSKNNINLYSGKRYYCMAENEYFNLEIEERTMAKYDSICVTTTEDSSIVKKYPSNGTNPYTSLDNVFLLSMDGTTFNTIGSSIVGRYNTWVVYKPMVIESVGNYLIDPGDVIKVTVDGNEIDFPIFNRVLHWNGNLTDTYECTASEEDLEMEDKEQYELNSRLSQRFDEIEDEILAVDAKASQFDSSLSNISVFQGGSSAVAANNNTYSFELPLRSHAIVAIAIGLVSFFNYGVLGYTDLPSGFTATMDENNIVTINRSSNTKFAIHGILFTPAW